MSNENRINPLKNFVPRFLPWLLGAGMCAIFLVTLNRWVTMMNLGFVANVSGWVWQPQLYAPLSYLVTLPFRILPTAQIPLALNIFSALCGAATLGLLARCVAILPHDRTELERQREKSDFSFLTGWVAWFPPVLAVALAGLQLTFWKNATSFTGETFDLLLFAIVVWQLLEYRLDEAEWRLFLTAIIYGAGIAEDWAFVGFFPVFIMAVIWLRKLDFFNAQFLGRMFFGGFAGLLFFLLLPIVAKCSTNFEITFWQALRPGLQLDWSIIHTLSLEQTRHTLGLILLTIFAPLLLLSIRWSSSFGDNNQIANRLVNYLFHAVNLLIFGALIWIMFDPPFSPHQLSVAFPAPIYGSALLTIYFLAALSIGYYCGYFLLVFGRRAVPTRRNQTPETTLPPFLNWLCPIIVTVIFVASLGMIGALARKNNSVVRSFNDDTFLKYAQLTTQNLPPDGAILLTDSENPAQDQPTRSYLIQALLAREGRAQNFPVIDTQALNWSPYHRYLHARYPNKWPLIVDKKDEGYVPPLNLLRLLVQLSKTNTLVYLNPSFGYYFEQFYQEPHGLIYFLKTRAADTVLPPPLDQKLIAENEAFWTRLAQNIYPAIEKSFTDAQPITRPKTFSQKFFVKLHAVPEQNINTVFAGAFYSRSENYWGVQLQRAGQLDAAARHFSNAIKINTNNVNAQINLAFNRTLRAGTPTVVDLSRVNADQFGNYRTWNEVIDANGPFDETSFCFEDGIIFIQNAQFHQAAAAFERVRQLAPENLAARLWLAQIYIFAHQPDRALEALREPLAQPTRFGLNENNSTEINVLASGIYFQKNETARGAKLLENEAARHPTDDTLLTAATQALFMRGLYTNALRVIQIKLEQTPDAPQWLFGKGYAEIQIGNYKNAIAALTRVLEIQTNDPTARFNRALAYLDSKNFAAARADYLQLQSTYTNSFQIAFGLGEIAWQKKDTGEAIRNYQIYLANAPTNSAEAKTVSERLKSLQR
jgi:tetratricopeptide (TPR) repeat protein